MGGRTAAISQTELEVLKSLWQHGAGTVREIDAALRRQGRRWAYTTVQTLLHRLERKGYVECDKSQIAHVFDAAMSRADFLRSQLDTLATDVCDGAAAPLVLALVEQQDFSDEEIARFRSLLDRLNQSKPGGERK